MKYWSRYPVFRFLIPFSAGILFVTFNPPETQSLVFPVIIFLLLSVWFARKNLATGKYAHRWLGGIPFYFLYFFLGALLTTTHILSHTRQFDGLKQSPVTMMVSVLEEPVQTHSGLRFIAKVEAFPEQMVSFGGSGKILVNLLSSDSISKPNRGDLFIVSAILKKIPPPANPGSFDYASYMARKGVYFRCHVKHQNFRLLESNRQTDIVHVAHETRDYLLGILRKYIPGQQELGVAGALLLGYEDWLDPELEAKYSMSGVLHILCVSGMHVGLMYLILNWLLSWMDKKKKLLNLKFPFLILSIWFYSLVTGFAPSIIRAATMFSFVIIGKWLRRPAAIYNCLCTSCLILFIVNPFMILAPGFQLSFLAVVGIVVLQKPVLELFNPPGLLLFKTWELAAVSLAAQVATSPLSLFLFHQFPNYFLLSNLIVVPLTTVGMYLGLILFAVDPLPYGGMITGWILYYLIMLVNRLVEFFGSLPGAVTTGIHLTVAEMCLGYLLIIFLFAWYLRKSATTLHAVLSVIILLFSFRIYRLHEASDQYLLTVYSTPGSTAVSLIRGREALLIGDTLINDFTYQFNVEGHLTGNLVSKRILHTIHHRESIRLTESKVSLINGFRKGDSIPDIAGQTVILGGKTGKGLEKVLIPMKPRAVIFDSSFRFHGKDSLKVVLENRSIRVHDVTTEGFYSENLFVNR